MNRLGKTFVKGLLAVMPAVLTLYVLVWFAGVAESYVGAAVKQLLPPALYVPGMGILLGFLVVLGVGLLINVLLVRRLMEVLENVIMRIPVIRILYGSVRDMIGFFGGSERSGFSQVVLVDFGDTTRCLGFLTRRRFDDLPPEMGEADRVAVYVPMSYQLGGFTVLVPRDAITPVDMTIQQAMRFALTGGVRNPTVDVLTRNDDVTPATGS